MMNTVSTFFKYFFWLVLGMVILSTGAIYYNNRNHQSAAPLPVYAEIPDFSFTSQSGQAFGLQDVRGKVNVVDFIFTSCGAACPVMSTEMGELYNQFAQNAAVQFISFSVDPENDTLERLQEYAQGYGVTDRRWSFLRGPITEVSNLAETGFMVSGDFPANHSTKFILVDQQAQVRGYYDSDDSTSVASLKKHIRQLAR